MSIMGNKMEYIFINVLKVVVNVIVDKVFVFIVCVLIVLMFFFIVILVFNRFFIW